MSSEGYSVAQLIDHGSAMLANGWKVEKSKPDSEGYYQWVSPRGTSYPSMQHNVPPVEAVNDATVEHEDYPCTPLMEST